MKLSHFLFSSLLLTHSLANAQSYVYVTDMVDIPMRSSNKIERDPPNLLKMLPSGAKLEILSTENGWTKVKYEKTIGWMISRYLTSKAPAQAQLEKLRQTYNANKLLIAKQSKRNTELETQVQALKNKNTLLSVQTSKSKAEKEHVEQVYKDALKLEHNNEKLKTEALQLKTEVQLLQNNNTAGQESSSRNWFIVGALVLFFGFIMGFVFPRRSNQRRF
ncbi:MAG TPA: TIGR04211 family SH3 domain-containing protein [Gammaproteobacteria bacterium]|nr:TIGR04211 family SH3 domain-containing protein [Gammaproteobacteria bacterium]HAE04820.1 TIGR04211 family SH3 domain-containing protein [Gammaproteobacteria bacterium]HAE70311.1 TIGR04211 family SH3 domain-containing protein [Gammaproteobacteria bacterium]HAE73316.1 TIGR04211 family SH3 domain-containing protein [Gammaproteobacteria bacterium]HAN33424.1 TIGR04211 family SH3 domain-containing protein [Gammaproteobacteria bacterium]